MIPPEYVDADCEGWYDTFHGMHYGLGFGDLSSYLLADIELATWWDPEIDPYGNFTSYTAMNHPDEDAEDGYNFIGYDFTRSLFVEVDRSSCVDLLGEDGTVSETVCGEVMFEASEDGGATYPFKISDLREDVGSRYAYIHSAAVWYEDFPNLDLDMMALPYILSED